jgi:hypothetical protein
MSNVIQFLETMGANAVAARMSIADYEAAVAALKIDDGQRESLTRRDHKKLSSQLEARDTLLCLVFSPSEEEEKRSPTPDQEGETPEEPSKSE